MPGSRGRPPHHLTESPVSKDNRLIIDPRPSTDSFSIEQPKTERARLLTAFTLPTTADQKLELMEQDHSKVIDAIVPSPTEKKGERQSQPARAAAYSVLFGDNGKTRYAMFSMSYWLR